MFSLRPALTYHVGLVYLCRQPLIQWIGNFWKLAAFTCILPELKRCFLLLLFWLDTPAVFHKHKKDWSCSELFFITFFKAWIQISSLELDKSPLSVSISAPACNLTGTTTKKRPPKAMRAAEALNRSAAASCTLRFVCRFTCCLCLSLPARSGLPQLFVDFELCEFFDRLFTWAVSNF